MPDRGSIMIILADHDRRVRLRKMSEEQYGLTVQSAANPMEALAQLQKISPPDFILLSSEPLALMTSEEFISFKNRIPEMKSIPIILLSIAPSKALPTGVMEEVLAPLSERDLNRLVSKFNSPKGGT